jgi:hypothetical protein
MITVITPKSILFNFLSEGDTFTCNNFDDDTIFMKIEECYDNNNNRVINAICLNDGQLDFFDEEDKVIKIDLEIMVSAHREVK